MWAIHYFSFKLQIVLNLIFIWELKYINVYVIEKNILIMEIYTMYTTGSTERNSSPNYYVISINAEYTYIPICVKNYLLYFKREK